MHTRTETFHVCSLHTSLFVQTWRLSSWISKRHTENYRLQISAFWYVSPSQDGGHRLLRTISMYKVVQIWPGPFVCKQATVCPGHIWTTLYLPKYTASRPRRTNLNLQRRRHFNSQIWTYLYFKCFSYALTHTKECWIDLRIRLKEFIGKKEQRRFKFSSTSNRDKLSASRCSRFIHGRAAPHLHRRHG